MCLSRAENSLDSVEEVAHRRMLARPTSIRSNSSHPLHHSVEALGCYFTTRLRPPPCRKELYRKLFLPSAIRLCNAAS